MMPVRPIAGEDITCSYMVTDPDADTLVGNVAWTISGMLVGTGDSLVGGAHAGDEVQCTVTPNDGTVDGIAQSGTVTVNSPPVIADLEINPSPLIYGDIP